MTSSEPENHIVTTALNGRGAKLRSLIRESTIPIPGAPWALAAKLAERSGFEAVYLSGAALSAGIFAVPDTGIVTLEQFIEHTRLIAEAVSIPVVVDADTGFGGPREVEECVRRLEAAGAAAIQIEDQRFPKRCGHLAGKELIEQAEMSEKILAATRGRSDPHTVIIARTDARGVTSLDDAITRSNAYVASGADWIFVEALSSRDEFARVGREIDAPLVANMTEFGVGPLLTIEELAQRRFAAVLYPVTFLRLAMKALEAGMAVLLDEGSQESMLDLMQSRAELYDLLGYDPSQPPIP